jgi:hypothetical protein
MTFLCFQGDVLSLFVPELCSNIQLTSDGEENFFGGGDRKINAFRFKPADTMFDYSIEENKCFCSTG